MARQLQAAGAEISLVVLLDSVAPGDYGGYVSDDLSLLADIQAIKNYHPPATSLPLLLLRATDEREDTEMAAHWRRLSSDNLEVHDVSGDHFTMMRAPHVSTLAGILRLQLTRT
jgi:thioesterase domain-containing protein